MDPSPDPRSEAHLAPLLDALRRTSRAFDEAGIRRAYEFAADAHAAQKRMSGEPYITHPVAVATILAELLGSGAATTRRGQRSQHQAQPDGDPAPVQPSTILVCHVPLVLEPVARQSRMRARNACSRAFPAPEESSRKSTPRKIIAA